MADPMQQARELLAAEYKGNPSLQSRILHGHHDDAPYFKAIAAALRAAPEGFVMVPVDLGLARDVWKAGIRVREANGSVADIWAAMLDANPQGVKDAR